MLHRHAGPRELAILRITVFGIWLGVLARTPPLARAASVPRELFTPPGVTALIPSGFWDWLLQAGPLTGFSVLLVTLTLAAAAGLGPYRLVGPMAFAALLLFDGLQKGYAGFINHAQFGILYGALFVAISPAADALRLGPPSDPAPDRPRGAYRYPLVATALLLTLSYSLIGIHRVALGGLEIFTGDALPTYVALRTFEYASYNLEWGTVMLAHAPLVTALKVGFAVTTLFEVLSPLALLYRTFRWAWLAVILPFHVLTLVTMNILFWENVILIVVLFLVVDASVPTTHEV